MNAFRTGTSPGPTRWQGFTLMEVLVVISIVGVLASMAVPSFVEFIKSQKVKAMASDLHLSLMLARSEAIKRNTDVTMAPVTAGSWPDGWTVANPDGGNIDIHSAISTVTAPGPASVVYQSSGRIRGATAPTFDVGAPGTTAKRCVSVDLSGRPYVKAAAC